MWMPYDNLWMLTQWSPRTLPTSLGFGHISSYGIFNYPSIAAARDPPPEAAAWKYMIAPTDGNAARHPAHRHKHNDPALGHQDLPVAPR
ncbi:hypothetical protein CNECB9_10027 [Cupriavidus necator]|uniref:Uncharacterized protein n=1 Tax=Cupriavidus necator TaxID=106590 RepID=A0A1K0JD84_CUPNE|nr:hypothetical protein CNECB9_10027 [Cupriavidus necator]